MKCKKLILIVVVCISFFTCFSKKRDPFAAPKTIVKSYCRYLGNAECDDQQYAFVEWKKEVHIINQGHVFDDTWRVCIIALDYVELEHITDGDKQRIEKNKE
ncbi:hypothetical protein A3F06_02095 [candidate division TM6 bacterium RIFCSPHIGHO2_12_FULL_36_22]|nr:MAG: hypothetical protein A3F06_02095 [candidate division TM6 bacterium RIFCSPHIGHO2_12_FULL_36_22]